MGRTRHGYRPGCLARMSRNRQKQNRLTNHKGNVHRPHNDNHHLERRNIQLIHPEQSYACSLENRRINYILATKPNTLETLHTLYRCLFVISVGRYCARPNPERIAARRSGRFGAAYPVDRGDRDRHFAPRHGHRNHR